MSAANFRQLMGGDELIVAPVALNPIMARLAEEAGFKAVYLSGGSLGWLKCVTEANLGVTEMVQVVLDVGGGFGDPVHVQRSVSLCEAAGVAAIELEDQLLPRRVEHHAGVDHLVPTAFMVEKIKAALAAQRDPNLVLIARTNARRVHDLDEALRRAEAFHAARADMLFIHTRNAEEMRKVGERLPPPLMTFAPPDGFLDYPLSRGELYRLGYRLAASSGTAFAAMYKAVRQSYECLAQDRKDPLLGAGGAEPEMKAAMATTRLAQLLELERRTMRERDRGGAA